MTQPSAKPKPRILTAGRQKQRQELKTILRRLKTRQPLDRAGQGVGQAVLSALPQRSIQASAVSYHLVRQAAAQAQAAWKKSRRPERQNAVQALRVLAETALKMERCLQALEIHRRSQQPNGWRDHGNGQNQKPRQPRSGLGRRRRPRAGSHRRPPGA